MTAGAQGIYEQFSLTDPTGKPFDATGYTVYLVVQGPADATGRTIGPLQQASQYIWQRLLQPTDFPTAGYYQVQLMLEGPNGVLTWAYGPNIYAGAALNG